MFVRSYTVTQCVCVLLARSSGAAGEPTPQQQQQQQQQQEQTQQLEQGQGLHVEGEAPSGAAAPNTSVVAATTSFPPSSQAAAAAAAAGGAPASVFQESVPDVTGWVQSVAVCRGSDLVATGAGDGVVRLWGVEPSKQVGVCVRVVCVRACMCAYLCVRYVFCVSMCACCVCALCVNMCVCACVCVRMRVCAHACVCVRACVSGPTITCLFSAFFIGISVFLFPCNQSISRCKLDKACVCVLVRMCVFVHLCVLLTSFVPSNSGAFLSAPSPSSYNL